MKELSVPCLLGTKCPRSGKNGCTKSLTVGWDSATMSSTGKFQNFGTVETEESNHEIRLPQGKFLRPEP